MKTNKLFAFIAVAALALASCKKEDPTPVFEPSLKVDKTEKISAPANGTTATVKVTANISWAATASQDWVTVSPASKSITDKKSVATDLTITIPANEAYEARTATVTLKAEGCNDIVLNIEQKAAEKPEPVFEAFDSEGHPITLPFGLDSAGDDEVVLVNANVNWTATSSDDSWLTAAPDAFTAQGSEPVVTPVTITAEKNVGGDRSATITFSAEGQENIVVTINQAAATTFTITVSNIIYNGATIDVTPSKDNIYYYFDCMAKAGTPSDDDVLFAGDMDYWYGKYGQSYADYGYDSFEELYFDNFVSQGADGMDLTGYLDPETTYVAYAYEVLPGLQLGSVVARYEFTTPEEPAPDPSYENLLGEWDVTGQTYDQTTSAWSDATDTWTLYEMIKNQSYMLVIDSYGLADGDYYIVNFDADNKKLVIPTGAGNFSQYHYNFGLSDSAYIAFEGYDLTNTGSTVDDVIYSWSEDFKSLTSNITYGHRGRLYWHADSSKSTYVCTDMFAVVTVTKAAAVGKYASKPAVRDIKARKVKLAAKSNKAAKTLR